MTEDTRLPEYGRPAVISLTKMGQGQGADCEPGSNAGPNCNEGTIANPNCPAGQDPIFKNCVNGDQARAFCNVGTGGNVFPPHG